MNLKLLCRIFGVIATINALSFLFATEAFLEAAGLSISPSLITLAQGFGVSVLILGLLSWRTPDIAGDSMPAYGQLFGVGHSLFVLLLVYQITTDQVAGLPAYGNLLFSAVLAALFFMYSKHAINTVGNIGQLLNCDIQSLKNSFSIMNLFFEKFDLCFQLWHN